MNGHLADVFGCTFDTKIELAFFTMITIMCFCTTTSFFYRLALSVVVPHSTVSWVGSVEMHAVMTFEALYVSGIPLVHDNE
jgi:hypothetical protein